MAGSGNLVSERSPESDKVTIIERGAVKRGEASLVKSSPFPLTRGRGIKGDGVIQS